MLPSKKPGVFAPIVFQAYFCQLAQAQFNKIDYEYSFISTDLKESFFMAGVILQLDFDAIMLFNKKIAP